MYDVHVVLLGFRAGLTVVRSDGVVLFVFTRTGAGVVVGVLCCVCRVYVTLPVLLMLAVLATIIAVINSLLKKTRV